MIWPLELKFLQKRSTLAYKSVIIIRKFCFALRQMAEMPYFHPHSLTVAAPSPPPLPPFPLCNVDLGLVLIARKLFVEKLIRNLQCCFPGHKQFPGNQSAQVPSQHCIGGRGGGGMSRNVAVNKAFQSFVLKRNKTF